MGAVVTPAASDTTPGRFVAFEGGEGAGKSTQIARLAAALRAIGVDALTTREPGGTPGAEAIRGLLVAGAPERWLPHTELLLHLAARHDHAERVIRPALAAGRWVLCDRFADSTRVYQGCAGGVELELIDALHARLLPGLAPDLTVILDVPVEIGLDRRRGAGGTQRYERMDAGFHAAVREGFLKLARRTPTSHVVVDAMPPPDTVAARLEALVRERFGLGCGAG